MKRSGRRSVGRSRMFVLALICTCVFLIVWVLLKLQSGRTPLPSDPGTHKMDSVRAVPVNGKTGQPKEGPLPAGRRPDDVPAPREINTVTDADLDYIAARNLLIPVANITSNQLRDTFNQARSEGRQHDAIDIMAPQGTPVLATADGRVIKLFQSDKGGVTLYELDPSGQYVYYYAHLMRYADDIEEGRQLRRGDVIAYVGDTGNAGAGKFHLHFAISKIASPHQWSGGDPINPYPLLIGR